MDLIWLQDLAGDGRWVVLVLFLGVTSWTDTQTERIRNVHTFPTMLMGLLLGLLAGGASGIGQAAVGIVVAFVAMFPLFATGVMKAGDAKMLMAIGALVGPVMAVRALIASFVIFLPVAIVLLFLKGKLGGVWQSIHRIWRYFYTSFHPLLEKEPLMSDERVMTPYAMVLGVATLLVWQTPFLDFGLDVF